jgi:hypothetical protein
VIKRFGSVNPSGVGGSAGLFGFREASATNPLAVEPDLTGDLANGLVKLVHGLKGGIGERLTCFLFRRHGRPVGTAEPSQAPSQLVVHAHMVPQGMRHYLVAYVHGDQSRTLRASAHAA